LYVEGRRMKFVLANGRTPHPESFCALCCEPVAEAYLRDIATRLAYCDHSCYLGHRKSDALKRSKSGKAVALIPSVSTPLGL
jgi:hypothetical protein